MSNNATITVYTGSSGIKNLQEDKCCTAKLQKDGTFKYPIIVPIDSLEINFKDWNGDEGYFDEGQEISVNLRSN